MEAQKAVEKKNDKIQLIIKWVIAIGVPALIVFLDSGYGCNLPGNA